MSAKYNIFFYNSKNSKQAQLCSSISSLPLKIHVFDISKLPPSKIPKFVTVVPYLKMNNGEVYIKEKLLMFTDTLCKRSGGNNNNSDDMDKHRNSMLVRRKEHFDEKAKKFNHDTTGDADVAPIMSGELGGFSDNYSLIDLQNNNFVKKRNEKGEEYIVENSNPLSHGFEFLSDSERSSSKMDFSSDTESAFSKMQQLRQQEEASFKQQRR